MAEACVTDTNALIHYLSRDARLGRRAALQFDACREQRAIAYVPVAVLWEMGHLMRKRRVRVGALGLREVTDVLFSNPAFQPFPLDPEQVCLADEAGPNEDTFDRLICAAARVLDLPLLTSDLEIQAWSGVRTIW